MAKVLDQCVTNPYCTDNLLLSWSWDFGADDFSTCIALSSSAPASGWDAVGWEGADASWNGLLELVNVKNTLLVNLYIWTANWILQTMYELDGNNISSI